MSVITEYTVAHIKNNRRTSLAIMIAVLLAGTLICSFAMLAQGGWAYSVRGTHYTSGNWHGELFDNTPGEKLPIIESNPHVETIMIKGAWQTVKLPGGSALPYFMLRDANAPYWSDMGEQYTLMEGRLPQKPGEIAVSKLLFDRNPQFKVGDTYTLEVGDRMLNGEVLSSQEIRRKGETFLAYEEKTFTITGKLDLSTSTASPGYYAMGFLEREAIKPDDDLTVYLRFHNIYKTFALMPEIAESMGYERDEFSEYLVRYHDRLLGLYLADIGNSIERPIVQLAVPLMTVLAVVLVAFTFVLIIKGMFSLSANARATQLGIFRSVGAAPAQILRSILLEGLILSALPLFISIGLGFAFTQLLASIYNNIIGDLAEIPFTIAFHWPTAAFGVLLSLAVVLLSARGPAKTIAKLTPIEAVRGGEGKRLKRRRIRGLSHNWHLFGFTGELAAQSMSVGRKSFRSSTAAVCISFVLIGGLLCMLEIAALSNKQSNSVTYYDVTANLFFVERRDDDLVEKIRNIPGVTESAVSSLSILGLMVEEADASDEFAAIGGFGSIDANRYNIAKKGDSYRIGATLYGLDDRSFSEYCVSSGLDPNEYLNAETPKAIIQNITQPYFGAREREKRNLTVELLRLTPGDTLTFLEQAYDDMNTNHTFNVTVGAVATKSVPQVNGGQLTHFRPVVIVPLSQYDKIVAGFLPERAAIYRRADVDLLTGADNSLETEKLVREICAEYLASEDYILWSKEGEIIEQARVNGAVNSMNTGIAVMIALIGVSNAFSSVAASLRIRRREFAMLRSVGLDNKGLNRLLILEGLRFSLRPILLGLPYLFLICHLFMWMTDIKWAEYLPVFPVAGVLLYAFAALLLMGLAYWNGARDIRGAVIVDALRDERV